MWLRFVIFHLNMLYCSGERRHLTRSPLYLSSFSFFALFFSVNAFAQPALDSGDELTQQGQPITPWVYSTDENPQMSPSYPQGFLALLNQHSPEDVEQALLRAEQLFLQNNASANIPPIALVIHGPEVAIFFRENYAQYKTIVDLAARLSALHVVDLTVCETRMGVLGRNKSELLPFVNTVPFGPAEEQRLLEEKRYRHF